jgi:hypothetical protein
MYRNTGGGWCLPHRLNHPLVCQNLPTDQLADLSGYRPSLDQNGWTLQPRGEKIDQVLTELDLTVGPQLYRCRNFALSQVGLFIEGVTFLVFRNLMFLIRRRSSG